MTYRAGIVGCGRIGCGFDDDPRRTFISTHAGAYARTPGVELVGLADLDPAKIERYGAQYQVAGRYLDYRRMLEHERLDIVSVCTWADTHQDIVNEAVQAGVKAIFCEKPLADNLAAADAMLEACTGAGVILMVNHKRRFDPLHQRIAAYLQGGGLGRVQQVSCYYTAGLANTCSHLFDLLRFYFGDVSRVLAVSNSQTTSNLDDPNLDGWLWLETGAPAVIQSCDACSYYLFEVNVLGTAGRMRISSGTQEQLSYERVIPSPRASEYQELQSACPPVQDDGRHDMLLYGVQHLVECLATAKTPISTGVDGRRALELICACMQSAQQGGVAVSLPLSTCPVTVVSR